MNQTSGFVDIHCHLLPGIDDGAKSPEESLAMARMAVADGISTVIVTPHQLGGFAQNHGDAIRERTADLSQLLAEHNIPLTVLPGADVRIEPDMIARIQQGDVLSLADHRRHVLLELPHEIYVPLDRLLAELKAAGMVGILSHPERNAGIMANPAIVGPLVDAGCLMQITAGSLLGMFGPQSQNVAERLAIDGLVHFVSTDAHGLKSRRPQLARCAPADGRTGRIGAGRPMNARSTIRRRWPRAGRWSPAAARSNPPAADGSDGRRPADEWR